MGVLSELEPKKVFSFFEDICRIPHGSTNVRQISDYLMEFAKERNLSCRQDEAYNVVIKKEATAGYENAPAVILQGHMDMVAVQTADCQKDMTKEGLDLEICGDYISAKGTSLGADNGIAVAYMLALLDDDTLSHPAVEAVFTTDEEIGLLGATALDTSDLKGKILLNMDSEDEGIFTVSCAGGATVFCNLPYKTETIKAAAVEIALTGFTGGHSGTEINKGRMNAANALARLLLMASRTADCRIITLQGGIKDNAITHAASARIAVPQSDLDRIADVIRDTFDQIKDEQRAADPDAHLDLTLTKESEVTAVSKETSQAAILLMTHLPSGVQKMSPEIEGLVQTSLNLGILQMTDDLIQLGYSVRSSKESEKRYLIYQLDSLTGFMGGSTEVKGDYPGWDYRPDSVITEILVREYKKLSGKDAVVEGIHAGLECGVFASKIQGLDAISFGPQMRDVHTPKEQLSISSVERTWQLLLATLEALH